MGEVGAVRDEACQWALTQKRTLGGGRGALERRERRRRGQDGSERGGALVFDAVVPETTMDGCGGTVRGQVRVSAGADTKANTLGAAAYSRLEILVSLRTAASAEAPWSPIELPKRLQRWGGARMVREREFQRALT